MFTHYQIDLNYSKLIGKLTKRNILLVFEYVQIVLNFQLQNKFYLYQKLVFRSVDPIQTVDLFKMQETQFFVCIKSICYNYQLKYIQKTARIHS